MRLLVSVVLSLWCAGLVANAQTDFPIHANSPNLKAEFKKELDKWMERAYEGDAEAQFKVGVLFANEQFKSADYEQAVYWYKQAARQGHTLAQYNLGHQYLNGIGVKPSEATAMSWWLKAAKQGHPLAQFNVGRAYYLGIGLKKDLSLSRIWFERAASNQEPRSIEILEQLGWATPGQYAVSKQPDTAPVAVIEQPSAPQANTQKATPKALAQPTPSPAASAAAITQTPIDTANDSLVITERPQRDSLARRSDSQEITSKVQPVKVQPVALPAAKPPVIEQASAAKPAASELAQSRVVEQARQGETASLEKAPAKTEPVATLPVSQPSVSPKPTVVESNSSNRASSSPASNTAQEPANSAEASHAIAVYTNPAIRSVLIAVLEERDQLQVVSPDTEWTAVRSPQGFPVWVSGDYIRVNAGRGTITGSAVNARSVPIVIRGTVVGRLDKNETVTVLESRGNWYRIQSPTRFQAWVKTSELKTRPQLSRAQND
ncbi:SH3 domain-containing protein [Arenicella xantha]|uniref:TPR repeat protein n=1 Tax=Arenicella xantha TaxID=644221 RepID=A0A395JNQ3_9GAMM|nr:SH3 domain-containing protein [Arenicella xantha]RBP53127.1 TPR repeat protein [Arenicella xantha]